MEVNSKRITICEGGKKMKTHKEERRGRKQEIMKEKRNE